MNASSLFSCKGKVAVVSGGAGLLGRTAVLTLKGLGAVVYCADLDLQASRRAARSTGARFAPLDISSAGSVEAMFARLLKETGRLDILVNCAYPRTVDWGKKLGKVTLDSWKKNVDSHLGGYFLCSRAAAESMKRKRYGSIINFASIYGMSAPDFSIYQGTPMTMPAAYSAIKGGIIAFTRYLSTYYGRYGVRANLISPGGIGDRQAASFVRRYCARTPLGRMGRPDDIRGAVAYLASDASLYVTGTNLVVDGGWTAW